MANNIEPFLISEYNALQARSLGFEQILSARINLFLIVNGASIAGYSGLAQVSKFNFDYTLIFNFLCCINFIIGIFTLKYSKDQSIAIASFHRRSARIRRYFYDLDPNILPYLPFPPSDERPKYYVGRSFLIWRGGDPILIVINSLLLGIFTYNLFCGITHILGLTLTVLIFFLTTVVQIKYLERQLINRDIDEVEEGNVNFLNEDLKKLEEVRSVK